MTPVLELLTHREEEVLALYAEGFGLREIAQQLALTERQVRRIKDRAREKLGASTTASAVAILVRFRVGAA